MLRLWLATCVLALASIAAGTPPPSTAFNPNWGVVFPAANAQALAHQCSRASPGPVQGTWTPTAQQIAELEDLLFPTLAVQLIQRELSDQGWQASDYYRQYGGLIIAGQRIIYVNAVHRYVIEQSHQGDAWKTAPVGICDGGELAFGVEYDPETKTLAKFQFNGKV